VAQALKDQVRGEKMPISDVNQGQSAMNAQNNPADNSRRSNPVLGRTGSVFSQFKNEQGGGGGLSSYQFG